MASRSRLQKAQTTWYDVDFYDDEEIERFNRKTKNSRHSLETEDDSTDNELIEEDFDQPAEDFPDGGNGLMSKLFHSTPTSLGQQKGYIRPRAPTNEKLEKYKFMLINIEPDADILDPGTFPFMQDSYMGFDFNDYPAEVLYITPGNLKCF